jgi:hypothetical protein
MVLRRMFRLKKDEVLEERRKLHNAVLFNVYLSPDVTG